MKKDPSTANKDLPPYKLKESFFNNQPDSPISERSLLSGKKIEKLPSDANVREILQPL